MTISLKNLSKKNESKIKNLARIYLKEITRKKTIKLDDLNKFIKILKFKANFFWIYNNRTKIGFVGIYYNFTSIRSCYIRDFFILKKYRKKRKGTLVFKKIINICKKKKLKKIKIDILRNNRKVEKFWISLGFKKKMKSYYYKINYASN